MIRRAQSLVEFALVAPMLIVLAMAIWDGGSALREQVVLDQAARDGARVGATAYGGAQQVVIQDAVLASAADLPALASTTNYLTVTSSTQSVTVRLQYAHSLVTPVLRQLWGGGRGTLLLSSSATFYVPQLTPTPGTVVPSTPIPSPTPTSTATPTPSATATPTPGVMLCARELTIPPLGNNTGYYVTLQLTAPSLISAGWSIDPQRVGGQIELDLYAGTPLNAQPEPSSLAPPTGAIASNSTSSNQGNAAVAIVSPQNEPAGTYTVYFFKRGAGLNQSSNGGLGYASGTCQ